MNIQMDEISIRCMGCNSILHLEQAVHEGWQMCKRCQFAICSFCYEHLDFGKHCLSYLCSAKHLAIEPMPLPIEKILVFAEENYLNDYRKGILYKLFYENAEQRLRPNAFVIQEKTDQPNPTDRPTQIQEEVWKNFQLVITKRRGGKFITWERVV